MEETQRQRQPVADSTPTTLVEEKVQPSWEGTYANAQAEKAAQALKDKEAEVRLREKWEQQVAEGA